MKDYIVARLSEPSTWRGIIYLLIAAGVKIDPTQIDSIVAVGLSLAGMIAVVSKGQ